MTHELHEDPCRGGPSFRPLHLAICAAQTGGLRGAGTGAQAAAVINGFEFIADESAGVLLDASVDNVNNTIDISKAVNSLDPIRLRFTVGHVSGGGGNQYDFSEAVTNASGHNWLDFHYEIEGPSGVVFANFNSSTLSGFSLDAPPVSGPDALHFTGSLADGGVANAAFLLSLNDPGAGNSYTFDLVQAATVPVPAAAWLMGSALAGLAGLSRRRKVA
jgi:hypothetical protein